MRLGRIETSPSLLGGQIKHQKVVFIAAPNATNICFGMKLYDHRKVLSDEYSSLYFCQRLVQILKDVFYVFDPDRDAHQAVGDAEPGARFRQHRSMGHRRRMRN